MRRSQIVTYHPSEKLSVILSGAITSPLNINVGDPEQRTQEVVLQRIFRLMEGGGTILRGHPAPCKSK